MSKSASISIEQSLSYSLKNLFKPSPTFIIGISGGPDSMALLYALYKAEVNVIGVHINYGLRGEESDLDQELCEGMCFEWGFECCSIALDSTEASGENFQNWARDQRYRIFRDFKREYSADGIITAHHQNDQIETILQRLFRGSGPEAWQGLKVWDEELFRPLLKHTKHEILEYCDKNSVPYRIDKSNLESKYARNFLRNELAEELDSFFPGWMDNILEISERGLVTEHAIRELLKLAGSDDGLSITVLNGYPKLLRISIIKKYLESKLKPISLSKGRLKQIESLTHLDTGKEIRISDQLILLKDRDYLVLKEKQSINKSISFYKEALADGLSYLHFKLELKENNDSTADLFLDSGKLMWPLTIRTWEKGDKIIPFGMSGSQKISDHLTNRKIPSSIREKALILSGSDSTIYAIIFPSKSSSGQWGTISNLVKCTSDTKEYLTLNF